MYIYIYISLYIYTHSHTHTRHTYKHMEEAVHIGNNPTLVRCKWDANGWKVTKLRQQASTVSNVKHKNRGSWIRASSQVATGNGVYGEALWTQREDVAYIRSCHTCAPHFPSLPPTHTLCPFWALPQWHFVLLLWCFGKLKRADLQMTGGLTRNGAPWIIFFFFFWSQGKEAPLGASLQSFFFFFFFYKIHRDNEHWCQLLCSMDE